MTDDPQSTTTTFPARTLIILLLAVFVLVGGGFVFSKLTHTRDTGQTAPVIAEQVAKALRNGDTATIEQLSTSQGRAQLEKIKAGDVTGFKFGGCGLVPVAQVRTQLCLFSRPGGELRMFLTRPGDKLKVNQAEIGPAGLPPNPQTPPSS